MHKLQHHSNGPPQSLQDALCSTHSSMPLAKIDHFIPHPNMNLSVDMHMI